MGARPTCPASIRQRHQTWGERDLFSYFLRWERVCFIGQGFFWGERVFFFLFWGERGCQKHFYGIHPLIGVRSPPLRTEVGIFHSKWHFFTQKRQFLGHFSMDLRCTGKIVAETSLRIGGTLLPPLADGFRKKFLAPSHVCFRWTVMLRQSSQKAASRLAGSSPTGLERFPGWIFFQSIHFLFLFLPNILFTFY